MKFDILKRKFFFEFYKFNKNKIVKDNDFIEKLQEKNSNKKNKSKIKALK